MDGVSSIVDRMYSEFEEMASFFDSQAEVSFRSSVDEVFRKSLLLAAASFFEKRIVEIVLDYVFESSSRNTLVKNLVENKALSRQYHQIVDSLSDHG